MAVGKLYICGRVYEVSLAYVFENVDANNNDGDANANDTAEKWSLYRCFSLKQSWQKLFAIKSTYTDILNIQPRVSSLLKPEVTKRDFIFTSPMKQAFDM